MSERVEIGRGGALGSIVDSFGCVVFFLENLYRVNIRDGYICVRIFYVSFY